MRKILNPFDGKSGYHCIGCDPQHPFGLRLRFYETEEGLLCRWKPDEEFQGYPDVLHGGIQATLLDEIAGWLVYIKLETTGVTKKIEVEYFRPVRISHGDITIRARLKEKGEKEAVIEGEILNKDNEICSSGLVHYFIYPPAIAVKRMHYPGLDAFLGEETEDFI